MPLTQTRLCPISTQADPSVKNISQSAKSGWFSKKIFFSLLAKVDGFLKKYLLVCLQKGGGFLKKYLLVCLQK